ncbi:hypothetical protein [Flagellimonas flava]|uniref:hypothetical protein n=1 Tax=Flagellimonas flava TaxID=570519 RepID=UPI0013F4D06C|nr:hypothetical protein [Allomuricauda flava]
MQQILGFLISNLYFLFFFGSKIGKLEDTPKIRAVSLVIILRDNDKKEVSHKVQSLNNLGNMTSSDLHKKGRMSSVHQLV